MIVGLCSVILWFVIFPKGLCKQRLTNHINDNSIQYFEQFTNITIPIMIHFDKELTLKLRKSSPHRTRYAMKTISKNVLKKVERLFLQPSLNQRIKLELIDARSLKRRLVNDTNISVYLKRYCTWQGERKNLRKMNYFSVLLTGLDMYHLNRMRKNWKATGRTYKGGVCSTYFSCTLLEWKPRNIVYLLAHEIAHRSQASQCLKNVF
ncbi:uncharacterized protein LOC128677574 isoform X2 [Plodia interpunctella]|uniref:uncharacterized protein LOC128677574 isoform X2 n=1 Tax=Plodia interpunctella TaxID=58824 RepID=UPI002367B6E2|nr:uncharacterized protein LOC128677574 isoform X2 [Plodia interpunctella]